ncbi:MAG: DsbA family oxidoreductase [Flavobacteriia bacterium]|nr:DsbA family oxidoreductase [Flavobacteriia bacterium]
MKIEIWSDVMCPFCYIGKRRLEQALEQIPGSEAYSIEWKSFQLDPDLVTNGKENPYEYLADRKGISYQESVKMHENVVNAAREVGLDYRFDQAVVANSLDAHRLSHLAKQHGVGNALEERLFQAYFTEGRDIADHATLTELGIEVGIPKADIDTLYSGDQFLAEVQRDIAEAQQIGVRGVPFFVFDRKYAVSGAQPVEAFLETINAVKAGN